jgi:hypothetical protein
MRRIQMENKENKVEMAKKIAKGKVDFLKHLSSYIFVMIVLAIINNVTEPGGYQWWLWPAGIWGIFVVINFLKLFVFKGGSLKKFEDQLVQKELDKMNREK